MAISRRHHILAQIGHGGFVSGQDTDDTFSGDLLIVQQLDKDGLIAPPHYHRESSTSAGAIDAVRVVSLTKAGRDELERYKRGEIK